MRQQANDRRPWLWVSITCAQFDACWLCHCSRVAWGHHPVGKLIGDVASMYMRKQGSWYAEDCLPTSGAAYAQHQSPALQLSSELRSMARFAGSNSGSRCWRPSAGYAAQEVPWLHTCGV